jgi:HAE1 family hydrophobic/amphiphilic exporter-1
MSITNLAIKRPTFIVVVFTILGLLGVFSYFQLKYDLIPKMSVPVVTITTQYPGASASAVEGSVTKKIEDAVSSLENVKSIQSTSMEGVSVVTIQLLATADPDLAIQDAQRKVNANLSLLPMGAKSPNLSKFSLDDLPIIRLAVTGKLPAKDLYKLIDDQIKPQFLKINGVGQVDLIGGTGREIRIDINREKIQTYGLNIGQIYQAIADANLELPTGKIEGETKQYTLRLAGKAESLADIQNIAVAKTSNGGIIKLIDIANVVDGSTETTNLNRINGENSIGFEIRKQSDANTVDVSKQVRAQLTTIEKMYSNQGVKFDIASDNAEYTLQSVHAVMDDLVLAIILVALVMFLFLHSYRNSLIVLVSIPTSIISVFAAMYVFDFTLNVMTLMALSLVIGILVDDSIVVLENIDRHLHMGKDKRQAALEGRNEIGFTAVAITLVDVVVFLPLSMVTGMIGGLLREFSLVIVFSTLMSLFVSFTITPLLASRFGKIEHLTRKNIFGRLALGFEAFFLKVVHRYEKVLTWGLNHRKIIYLSTIILLVSSFALVGKGFIGTEFTSEGDRGEFTIKLEGDPQNTLYQTNMITQKVEKILYGKPEVLKVFSNVGYSSNGAGGGANEQNKSEITVTIVPKEERKQTIQEYASMIKAELLQMPGIKVTATPTSIMGGANDAPIQVLLRGPEVDKLFVVADSVMQVMKKIPGASDVKLSVDKSKPELQISLDRDKMASLGLSVNDIASTLRLSFAGSGDLKFSDIGKDYDINVQFDAIDRRKIDDLKELSFKNSMGKSIQFSDFATIQQAVGPNQLQRFDRISSLMVNASVAGRPVGTVGQEIKDAISKKIHPGNITIDYKGQLEQQTDAFGSFFLVIGAAMIFVYLVMVALYNSYMYPFVVLFSIPVAIIGSLFALAISGKSLSIFAMIGFIMLMGLVAKNAILIVDFTNQLRTKGLSVTDALIEAGKERLRPILMTTLAMVFGMLPIALSTGASAESKNGLAWVIIGGLTSSLLLTLVLVPAVYATMEKYKEKVGKLFEKKEKEVELEIYAD